MLSVRLAAVSLGIALLAGLLLGGCHAKRPATQPVLAPPADQETLRAVRESFQQIDPAARVGLVLAVTPDARLAAVGNVDVKEFRQNQAITFIDSNRKPLVSGMIVNIVNGFLDVKYETPAPGQRAPREGDLAVRFGAIH